MASYTGMEIKAEIVTVDDGPPVVVGFADAPSNPANYLLLSYDPATLDGGLYIELNDQIRSGYDLVKRIQLLDSSVVIELTSDGQKVIKTGSTLTIVIASEVQNWQSTKQRLATLLHRWL